MWSSASSNQPQQDASQDTTDSDEDYSPSAKKPKLKKGSWSEKNMTEALLCCRIQELGVEEASQLYGIPKRSLRSRLKDRNFFAIDDKYRVFVLPVFPAEAEAELVDSLQNLINSQFTFTSLEIRRLAYELISEKYNSNNLPQEKDCILGNRWYKSFMTKYPHLETENPLPRAYQRKSGAFYDALESLIETHQIDPSRIFSVDGVELKFRASNADDFDKIFHRRKIIYTDAKAICCISPSGVFIPPVFIKPQENIDLSAVDVCQKNMKDLFGEDTTYPNEFLGHTIGVEDAAFTSNPEPIHHNLTTAYDKLKEMCNSKLPILPSQEDIANIKKQIKAHLSKKLQPMSEENEEELREKLFEQFKQLRNKIVHKYENSLNVVTSDTFYNWLQNFIAYVKPNPQQKTLLLLSDQSYVKCLKTLEVAKSNGILFLVLPPHSIHKIYPLDGFTMSLNRNLSMNASMWLGKNPDFKIQQVPLNLLFKKAYSETVNTSIAKNGFLYSGIWPVNRNIFDSTELGGESLLLQQNSGQASSVGQVSVQANSQTSSRFGQPDVTKDLDKLCRVCMKEKMYMKPLFDTASQATPVPNYHGKKISEITLQPISCEDGLPRSICQYCLVQLMDAIKIRNLAIESHKKQVKLKEAIDQMYFKNNGSKEKVLLSQFQYDSSNQIHTKLINRELTKEFDINSLCRICMGEKPLMTSMFFKPQGDSKFCVDTYKKVTEVSQCKVHIRDGLSSSICPFCLASVNQASEFIQRVLSSDKRFREIVTQIRQSQTM